MPSILEARWLGLIVLAACTGGGATPPSDGRPPPDAEDLLDADARPPDADTERPDAAVDAAPDAPITGAALQVNDVSILWPLPSSVAERDEGLLAATSTGPRGAIVPEVVYTTAGGMLAFGGQVAHSDLRVVAMRLDPCFAQTAPPLDGAGCEPQLRLILQPISSFPGAAGTLEASDAAVHTFHRITRAEAFAMAAALVELRLASSVGQALGPLAPHPLIASQGVTGAYAAGVRALILAHAGADNLVRVAILSSTSSQAWSFQIFNVDGATVLPRDIATLPAATQRHELVIFEGGRGSYFVGFTPLATGPLAYNALASSNLAAELGPAERQAQFDGLVATENPRLTTPETVACGDCHMATLVRTRIAEPAYALQASASPSVFLPDTQFVAPADLRPTLGSGFNLHAFSYNGSEPAISARTAHESAAVIEYLNLATP